MPRRRLSIHSALTLLASLLAGTGTLFAGEVKEATIFPAYGYRTDFGWRIPLRVWIHEPRTIAEEAVVRLARVLGSRSDREIERMRGRISDLIADDESGEPMQFRFEGDPVRENYTLDGTSDLNGLIEGELLLSPDRATQLLGGDEGRGGWLRIEVISEGLTGAGAIQLVPPQGRSLISDIDDTIKVTNIPAGRNEVLENTFFREFRPVKGMAERYRALPPDTIYHYVSGSPWQLYRPLAKFLTVNGFPRGAIQMKSVRKHLLTYGSWEDLTALAVGNATYEQKLDQIGALFRHFPGHRFILAGDSGEKDPEVYREIRRRYPNQVEAIWILDLVNAHTRCPERLAGMEVIDAETPIAISAPCP